MNFLELKETVVYDVQLVMLQVESVLKTVSLRSSKIKSGDIETGSPHTTTLRARLYYNPMSGT